MKPQPVINIENMKKTHFFIILKTILYTAVAMLMTLVLACSNEDGKDGLQGEPGTANVIYSDWFPEEFESGTSVSFFDVEDPNINPASVGNSAILAYSLTPSGVIYPLPIIMDVVSENYFFILQPEESSIRFLARTLDGSIGMFNTFTHYRYIIIPSGVPTGISSRAGKVFHLDGKTYSEAQIQALPYTDLCRLLNITE